MCQTTYTVLGTFSFWNTDPLYGTALDKRQRERDLVVTICYEHWPPSDTLSRSALLTL